MIIQIESIPVHFGQDYDGRFWYWAETGYTSKGFEDLGKAIAAAKTEIADLVKEFGCLPMFPIWLDNWIGNSEEI